MMRMPAFELRTPRSIEEAAAILGESPADTMLIAGGTDLVPNMKRRQQTPRVVVALRHLRELRTIHHNGGITIGAAATLTDIVRDERVRETCAGLWQAAGSIATPHLRNMGTIGGNLCLDTRCTYYDQSHEWRQAIGFCMKKNGATCWVATSSPKCLAVSSTDTAPMLQALGATVTLVSAHGTRTLGVADLFNNDGMHYLTRQPNEILTEVTVPDQRGWRSTYVKLRRRESFDFPVASVAAAVKLDADGSVADARVVLGAVASRPLTSVKASSLLIGHRLTADVIAAAADGAYEIAKPMDNTDFDLVWRKRMVKRLVSDALQRLAAV